MLSFCSRTPSPHKDLDTVKNTLRDSLIEVITRAWDYYVELGEDPARAELTSRGHAPRPSAQTPSTDEENISLSALEHRVSVELFCVETAQSLTGLFPDDPIAHDWRGHIMAWNGDYDRAAESYSRAITLDPDNHSHATYNAIAMTLWGHKQEAVRLFMSVIKKTGSTGGFCDLMNIPFTEESIGDHRCFGDKTAIALEGLLSSDPPKELRGLIHTTLGLHYTGSSLAKGVFHLEKAAWDLRATPCFGHIAAVLGRGHYHLGNRERAKECFTESYLKLRDISDEITQTYLRATAEYLAKLGEPTYQRIVDQAKP